MTKEKNEPLLIRMNTIDKIPFLKQHDKREAYFVTIELNRLIIASDCPLLGKFDTLIAKIERSHMHFAMQEISLTPNDILGTDLNLNVNLQLNLETRLFRKKQDGFYQPKHAMIKIQTPQFSNSPPETLAQLTIDLAQHVGAINFCKDISFESVYGLHAELNLSVTAS